MAKAFTGYEVATAVSDSTVIYHGTEVVKFDGVHITLNSGGWQTKTTLRRFNQAATYWGLKFSVYQKDFDWYVILPNGAHVAFYDGVTFKV